MKEELSTISPTKYRQPVAVRNVRDYGQAFFDFILFRFTIELHGVIVAFVSRRFSEQFVTFVLFIFGPFLRRG